MAQIVKAELVLVTLEPDVKRTDAIQSFVAQETPILRLTDAEGATGVGYSYTIGQGGGAIVSLLQETMLPRLLGQEAECIEGIWREMLFSTHATAVGAITSLALATIDTALWDLRSKRAGLPIHRLLGGARDKAPLYTTEGGWLHLTTDELVDEALVAKAAGFKGSKVKIGKPHLSEDRERLAAVRDAVGPGYEIMVDANQAFTLAEALRRANMMADYGVAWFEEPLPADDIAAHRQLAAASSVPVAVGESLYSLSQFKDYLTAGAASIIQVDAARIGGITPWLKVAHLAEAHNVPVCPHFLMELHVSLSCAALAAQWVEYIPQLGPVLKNHFEIDDGFAVPSHAPGLGLDWDWAIIERLKTHQFSVSA